MIKVIFLYQDNSLPSSRIRVLNLLPYLNDCGLKAEALLYPKTLKDKLKIFLTLKDFDIVVLQKKLVNPIDLYLLAKFSKKLVFDFDDAIYMNDDRAKNFYNKRKESRFKRIAIKSSFIIAGNPHLASKAREFNEKVYILPSAVFTDEIPVKTNFRKHEDPLILGWVGGGSNLHHLNLVIPALRQIADKIPFILRVISNEKFQTKGLKIENIKWDLKTQDYEITLFDAGLMPIPKNPWTEGKCSYKAIQYMAAGVIPVATKFGFNQTVIDDRQNGFLYDSHEEFIKIIEFIYQNPDLAFEMGKKAREKVKKEFSVNVIGRKLAQIIKENS